MTVELQETDGLINYKTVTPLSYSTTSKSESYSSISSVGLTDNNELTIILLGAAAGNFLEWFNFSLFALMADIFGQLFFPKGNTILHLTQVYALYAGVFFMRPIGGVIFGIIGDKFGRLESLKLSIILMGISTLITAILPTYQTIGIWSTILMIIMRLIQGLSVGGELSGALIYCVEICPKNHRAVFAILVQITGFGTLIASGIMAILKIIFTQQEILLFAWRIPFFFGCLIAIFGIWARIYLTHESNAFIKARKHDDLVENPVKYAFKTCKWRMLSMSVHVSFFTFAYYIYFVWFPTYFSIISKYNFNVFAINTFAMIICAVGALISCHWIDKYKQLSSSKVLIAAGLIHIILAIILFNYLNNPQDTFLAIVIWLLLSLSYGFYYGPGAGIWLINILPDVSCRYSAFGISYNIACACFGGTASLIATFVEGELGGISSIGITIFILGIFGISSDSISWYFHRKYTPKHEL